MFRAVLDAGALPSGVLRKRRVYLLHLPHLDIKSTTQVQESRVSNSTFLAISLNLASIHLFSHCLSEIETGTYSVIYLNFGCLEVEKDYVSARSLRGALLPVLAQNL